MDYKEKVIALLNSQELSKEQKEKLEGIFPELAESEDERIRKTLIHIVKGAYDKYGIKYQAKEISEEKLLTWIEKQGKKTEPIEGFYTEFERQISHLIASAINREHEYNKGYVKWAAQSLIEYAKREIEKQGEQKPDDIDNKFIRMRETKPKDISEFLDRLTTVEQEFLWEHIAKIRELDKEEQKPADKVEPKFKKD